jgi:glycerol-3-phosphate acyltransferase PlsY
MKQVDKAIRFSDLEDVAIGAIIRHIVALFAQAGEGKNVGNANGVISPRAMAQKSPMRLVVAITALHSGCPSSFLCYKY